MRSVIFIGILAFIIVITGGVAITWYAQQSSAVSAIEDFIAKVNEKEEHLTYKSIDTSGFPTELKISIKNPKFKGDMVELLDILRQAAPEKASQIPQISQWNEEISLNGDILLTVNALSDHYMMRINGNFTNISTLEGQTNQYTHTYDGATYCTVDLKRGNLFSDLWHFGGIIREPEAYLDDFRMFDCSIPASGITNTADNTVLYNSGPMRFYINSHPRGKKEEFRIYMNAAEMQITEEGSRVYSQLINKLTQNNGYSYPLDLAKYGKQNFSLDFLYKGPKKIQRPNNPNLEINLSQLNISNDAYQSSLKFYFANNTDKNGKRSLTLSTRAESNFTPVYDELIDDMIRGSINEIYTNTDLRTEEMQEYINLYNQDEMFSIIAPAIPNFSSMQKAVFSADIKFNGDPEFRSGELLVNDLQLSFEPYGIHAVGTGKQEARALPTGHTNIRCNNCAAMIDDIITYATRLQTTLTYFEPDTAAFLSVTPQLRNGLIAFLMDIAGPDKVNLTYDIVADPQTGYSINGQPFDSVVEKYFQHVAPAMIQNEKLIKSNSSRIPLKSNGRRSQQNRRIRR